jgi:hypothetical protein
MISLETLAKWRVTWFSGAVVLLLSAIICHWVSLRHNGQYLIIYTHALVEKTLEQHRPIVEYHRRLMGFWYGVGLISALLGMGCWIMALRSGKSGRSSVVVILLAVYFLSYLILI